MFTEVLNPNSCKSYVFHTKDFLTLLNIFKTVLNPINYVGFIAKFVKMLILLKLDYVNLVHGIRLSIIHNQCPSQYHSIHSSL